MNIARIIFVMLVALLVMAAGVLAVAEEDDVTIVAEGTCGDNLTWALDSEGLLIISGSGEMAYCNASTRWGGDSTALNAVIIEEGVTSIAKSAFDNCTNLTTFSIPDSVISIKQYAFRNCSNLTNIDIPNSVTSIGYYAFYGCYKLTDIYIESLESWLALSLDGEDSNPLCNGANLHLNNQLVSSIALPTGMTSVRDYAFSNCTSLNSISIPDSITYIGEYAFSECTNLDSVYITSLDSWLKLDSKSNPMKYASNLYLNGHLITNIVIPEDITFIRNYAFYNCNSLLSISVPDSIKSIGDYAFYNCSSLQNIAIPDSVSSIGSSAFYNCSSLTNISIPDSITAIDRYTFRNCGSLTNISIPYGVKSIGLSAFYNCKNITSVSMPISVTTIDSFAFSHCSSLTSISIHDGITYIGNSAFANCNKLIDVYFYGTNLPTMSSAGFPKYSIIHCEKGSLIETWATEQDYRISYFMSVYTSSLFIPTSTTTIGDKAFTNTNVEMVVLPDGCTTIGSKAFANCSELVSVYMPDSVTSIADDAFSGSINVTFICESENTAAAYADEHEIYWTIE